MIYYLNLTAYTICQYFTRLFNMCTTGSSFTWCMDFWGRVRKRDTKLCCYPDKKDVPK